MGSSGTGESAVVAIEHPSRPSAEPHRSVANTHHSTMPWKVVHTYRRKVGPTPRIPRSRLTFGFFTAIAAADAICGSQYCSLLYSLRRKPLFCFDYSWCDYPCVDVVPSND